MWIERTGKAPGGKMDAVIRNVAQTVDDTNEGRFDFISSAFLAGTGGVGVAEMSAVAPQPVLQAALPTGAVGLSNQGPGSLVLDDPNIDVPLPPSVSYTHLTLPTIYSV